MNNHLMNSAYYYDPGKDFDPLILQDEFKIKGINVIDTLLTDVLLQSKRYRFFLRTPGIYLGDYSVGFDVSLNEGNTRDSLNLYNINKKAILEMSICKNQKLIFYIKLFDIHLKQEVFLGHFNGEKNFDKDDLIFDSFKRICDYIKYHEDFELSDLDIEIILKWEV